ncbi:universal stress protein [Luteitalea sp.]
MRWRHALTPVRIVSAVDFSPHGSVVLAQALALAEWHDAKLDVLHVSPARSGGRPNGAADLHAQLEALVARLNTARIPTSSFVRAGNPVSAIVEHVAMRPADLIVAGQMGPRRAIYRSPGRFAAAVARRTGCAVITVPRRASVEHVQAQFRRIVCGVDDSLAAERALQAALHLAQESGGQLTMLHVVEGFPHEPVYAASSVPRLLEDFDRRALTIVRRLERLVPRAALHWCDVNYRVLPGVPHRTITAVAAAEGADLIVVGRPPRHWLGGLGSTVAGILAHSTCPVLTVPGPSGLRADTGMRLGTDAGNDRLHTLRPQQGSAVTTKPRGAEWRAGRTGEHSAAVTQPTLQVVR